MGLCQHGIFSTEQGFTLDFSIQKVVSWTDVQLCGELSQEISFHGSPISRKTAQT